MMLSFLLGDFRAATPENPRFSLSDPDAVDAFFGGDPSSTGIRVTREIALTYAPWWRGVRLLSDDAAKLPLRICDIRDGRRDPDPDHPADYLLWRKVNDLMTAGQWKRLMVAHAVQTGNGYSYVDRAGDARPRALLALDPAKVTPARVAGKLWYIYEIQPGEKKKLRGEDVLHVKGMGYDGLVGYSVYEKARESIGLGLGIRKYGAVFFKNNARPNAAIVLPKFVSDKERQSIREEWTRIHEGLDNSHKAAILQGGADLKLFTINARDAQMIEEREFETREVALWLGVPPHKLGVLGPTPYNMLEQANQEYLNTGLDPWLCTLEEECWDKLLTEDEKKKSGGSHYPYFDREQLLRADSAARAAYYSTATGGKAWMLPSEVRSREGLDPDEDLDQEPEPPPPVAPPPPIDQDGDAPAAKPKPAPEPDGDSAAAPAMRPIARRVLADAAVRMTRRIGLQADRAAKDARKYGAWLETFVADNRPVVLEALAPAEALLTALGLRGHQIEVLAADWLLSSLSARYSTLADTCTPATLPAECERCSAVLAVEAPAHLCLLFFGDTDHALPAHSRGVLGPTPGHAA